MSRGAPRPEERVDRQLRGGRRSAADSSRADLIAGGDLSVGGGGAQAPNGSVTYGGALQGSITTPNGQVTHTALPFDMNAQFAQLASQASAIAALTPNGTAGDRPTPLT